MRFFALQDVVANYNVYLPPSSFFLCAACLFLTGLLGIIYNYRNFIVLLMSIELLFLGVVLHFVFFAIFFGDIYGFVVALVILSVSAAELAIGLALWTVSFRLKGSLLYSDFSYLRSRSGF